MSGGNPPTAPPSTRSATRKATFDFVLKDVMGFEDDDLLVKALDNEGVDSVHDLLTLTDDQIDQVEGDRAGHEKDAVLIRLHINAPQKIAHRLAERFFTLGGVRLVPAFVYARLWIHKY